MSELSSAADAIHSASIHLLRRVAKEDSRSGFSRARLSALSVLVFAGPLSLAELAEAEHVSAPTMSNLVTGMERDGLAARAPHPRDGRAVTIRATSKGRRVLLRARARRLALLSGLFAHLDPAQLRTIAEAARLIDEAVQNPVA